MRRREFIKLIGIATAWPLGAHAQQSGRMRRIGVLMALPESDREAQVRLAAFREELQKLGWADVTMDTRYMASSDTETLQRLAKELVALQPDLLLSQNTLTTEALLQQTRIIPIIFAIVADPVGSGFVASFPRPGGNVTGFIISEPTMGGKWLELLKEIAPSVTRVLLPFNPAASPAAEYYLSSLKATATLFGVEASAAPVRDTSELESAVAAHAGAPLGGLVVIPDAFLTEHSLELISLAARYRLPAVYSLRLLLKAAACCPMEMTCSIISGARRSMPIASSRAQSRASCPSRPRKSSSWWSTSRRPRHSASTCPCNFSSAPTR
jgi:putative ABC transport system substrate-binding protein